MGKDFEARQELVRLILTGESDVGLRNVANEVLALIANELTTNADVRFKYILLGLIISEFDNRRNVV